MSAELGRGLSFPLGVDQRGAIALVSGDTDIAQAISIILATAPGERPMRPEFGCAVHEHVFDVLDAAAVGSIENAVREAIKAGRLQGGGKVKAKVTLTIEEAGLAHEVEDEIEFG